MDLTTAYTMARGLLDEHGLAEWTLTFDRAKKRAGVCRAEARTIGLSAPLTRLHDEVEVRDTVLHEIAHALVGPHHQHDAVWRRQVLEIGGSPQRCVPSEAPRVTAPWLGVCPAGHTAERHRRPERVMSCRQCSPRFSPLHLFEWTRDGRPAVMHPNYVAELRGLAEGRALRLLGVGQRARVIVPGELEGVVGTVVGRGRTSYHLRVREGVVRVVFAGAEPA